MNTTCEIRYSDFSAYSTCDISKTVDYVFKYVVVISSCLLFFAQILLYTIRHSAIKSKNTMAYTLLHITIFHGLFMGIRPLIEIITEYRSINNIWIALLTHIEAASSANIIIIFIYFQLNIIFKGSLRKKKIYCINNKGIILIMIDILQLIFFFIGPFVYHYTVTKANIMFWAAVIIITITTIPFFSFLGLSLYFKIIKMSNKRFNIIARHILFMVIMCSAIGGFTMIVAIFSMFNTDYEIILIELCWLSNIYLNFVIYLVLIRKRTSISKNNSMTLSTDNEITISNSINTKCDDV